jgi:hypothetical protein
MAADHVADRTEVGAETVEMEKITEGKAAVFFPKGQVFYNRVQVRLCGPPAIRRPPLSSVNSSRRLHLTTGSES